MEQRTRYHAEVSHEGVGDGTQAMTLLPASHGPLRNDELETTYFPPTGSQTQGTYMTVPLHGLMTEEEWLRVRDEVVRQLRPPAKIHEDQAQSRANRDTQR